MTVVEQRRERGEERGSPRVTGWTEEVREAVHPTEEGPAPVSIYAAVFLLLLGCFSFSWFVHR